MNHFMKGMMYGVTAWKTLLYPRLRIFIVLPLVINFLFFGITFWFGFKWMTTHIDHYFTLLPASLHWLNYLKSVITIFISFFFIIILSFFSMISANIFASSLNGLLSECYSNEILSFSNKKNSLPVQVLQSFLREVKKIIYYIPRLIVVLLATLIISYIPIINFLSTLIIFLFGSWIMAVQYLDYPADNRLINFNLMLAVLKKNKLLCYGFGVSIMIQSIIPIVNLMIMPVAVLGATKLWLENMSDVR